LDGYGRSSNLARAELGFWQTEGDELGPRVLEVDGKVFEFPVPPRPTREDGIGAEFDRTGLPAPEGEETETRAVYTREGWPRQCLSRERQWPGDPAAPRVRWTLEVDAITRPSHGAPTSLELPLRPLWPGFPLDTGFYSVLWALPLFGLPLLKQTRRTRRGRCPRCAYDLKRDFASGCPECGWRRAPGR
jgi:hypothetical protein